MTDEKKKMTAQGSSVGADDGQSISKNSENSIPTSGQKSNDEIVNSQDSLEEMYRKMQRMTDPRYLHTLTMTELFQTTYKSRPPVVEGLLYAGAYILAGAPKIGKSFLLELQKSVNLFWWRRSPTMSVPGRICGDIKSIRGRYFTLRWKMIFSVFKAGCL